jgi:hypothetical protein
MKAVEVLKEAGVLEERIIFVNLVSNLYISVESSTNNTRYQLLKD